MDPMKLEPAEFELLVKQKLEEEGVGLSDFEARHLEVLHSPNGDYEIDVTARFHALGADFLVLIECKRYSRPIERELVQVLHSKLSSCSAQKAMLWSTSGFRSGAREFALAKGIALVRIADGLFV